MWRVTIPEPLTLVMGDYGPLELSHDIAAFFFPSIIDPWTFHRVHVGAVTLRGALRCRKWALAICRNYIIWSLLDVSLHRQF